MKNGRFINDKMNNITPTGFISHSDYHFYNHFTPAGLASDLDYTINNNGTPFGVAKSRRDGRIIEQIIYKQLNPERVI
jgi:hypothetical protein